MYDIEMPQEIGFCSGIENSPRYFRPCARHAAHDAAGFPKDFLLFVDESHVTLPQVRAMYAGDRSRKESLVEYGFPPAERVRQPPTDVPGIRGKVHQAIYVSATPGEHERSRAGQIAEQVIRPTGLLTRRSRSGPSTGRSTTSSGECSHASSSARSDVLVATLTKKMAEI